MMLYTLAQQLINLLVVQVPGRMFAIDVSTVQMHCYLLFIQHHDVCFVQRKIPDPNIDHNSFMSEDQHSDSDDDENKDKKDTNNNKVVDIWDVSQTSLLYYPIILRWQPSIFNQTVIYNTPEVTHSMRT